MRDKYDVPRLAGQPMMRPEPFTPEQLERIAEDERRVRESRRLAKYVPVYESRRPNAYEVACDVCANLADFNAERYTGWCMKIRRMVSTWHPAICDSFKP